MKLEQQVVSLEISKRMRELGAPQESLYKYCGGHTDYHEDDEGEFEECANTDLLESDEYCHTAGLTCEFTISAYTVAELGEMLPARVRKDGMDYALTVEKHGTWHVKYIHYNAGIGYVLGGHPVIHDDTEADARAKMWIYLKENNLLPE